MAYVEIMGKSWLFILCITFGGCAGPEAWTNWQPYATTVDRTRTTPWAVVAYEGDVATLAAAGGKMHGRISGKGNQHAGLDDVQAQVQFDAAARGATHVILAKNGYSQATVLLLPGSSTTTVAGNTAYTQHQPPVYGTVTEPEGTYIAIRVEYANWSKLPVQLRPTTFAKH